MSQSSYVLIDGHLAGKEETMANTWNAKAYAAASPTSRFAT